jgi:hypothetical protein
MRQHSDGPLVATSRHRHGHFGAWLHAVFGMTDRTVQNHMRVAVAFGAKTAIVSDVPPTALATLAAPSTSTRFRNLDPPVALTRAGSGQRPPSSSCLAISVEGTREDLLFVWSILRPVGPRRIIEAKPRGDGAMKNLLIPIEESELLPSVLEAAGGAFPSRPQSSRF